MRFDEKNLFLNEGLESKEEVLRFISKKAIEIDVATSEEGLLKDLFAREEEYSTGIQDGFAIPHAKSKNVKEPTIFYIKTINSVKWETLDGSNVQYIFSIIVPEENENNVHLIMLSKLATCLMEDDFKLQIKNVEDKEKLVKYILDKMMEG